MRAVLFLLVATSAAFASPADDPVARLIGTAAASGKVYLDYRGPQPDGSCQAEAFALEEQEGEWVLKAENSIGVFRLRPWPENGSLHLTHNPLAGGFTVMAPEPLAIPGVAVFRPSLKCVEGATTSSDCTPVAERLRELVHMVSLMPVCPGGGS